MRFLLAALFAAACNHKDDVDDDDGPDGTATTATHDTTGIDSGTDDPGYVPNATTSGSAEMCVLLFGGADRIRGPDEGLPVDDTGRTLQVWARSGNPAEQIALSYGRPSPGQGFQLGTSAGFPILRVGTSSEGVITGNIFVGDDEWHHLVATWDGNLAALLVDGEVAGVGQLEGMTLEGDLIAGNTPTGDSTKPWIGWLDDAKILFGPRTPDDVAADPEGELVAPEDLLLWWDFELPDGSAGIGLPVPDLSEHGHDGLTAGVEVGSPRFLRCR